MSLCVSPCLTCSSTTFNSCLSCDTSIDSLLTLSGSVCLVQPKWYIQLGCTCALAVFVLMVLVRKRSLVLIKIFDIIQTISFFKYINGYLYYRHNLLYLQMRGMTPWSQGWQLFSFSGDMVTPVFLTEETFINKLARVGAIWLGILVLLILVAIFRICCRESKMEFSTFMSKNIKNTISIALYFTIQDISFFCAANFYKPTLSSTSGIIFFISAISLAVICFTLLIWMLRVVNYAYSAQDKQEKLFNYEMMFLFRMDYDTFQTYELTNLPERQKMTYRYSNLSIIEFVRKIGYAFLVCSFLYKDHVTLQTEIYSLLGYIIFFQLLWYIAMPFDPRTEVLQLILNIIADILLLTILIFPLINNSSTFDVVYLLLCLSLYALALASILLQIFRDLYNFIPYDLYDTGLKVVIEDRELRKQLQRRKSEQEYNQKKIRELKEEQDRLKEQLGKERDKKGQTINHSRKPSTNKRETRRKSDDNRQYDSEIDLNQNEHSAPQNTLDEVENNDNLVYKVENSDIGDDEEAYRVDTNKKRLVYNFNKKQPFVYSNKLDD